VQLAAGRQPGLGDGEPGGPAVLRIGLAAGQAGLDQLGGLPADRGRVGLLDLGQVGHPHGAVVPQRKQQHQRGELRTQISGFSTEHALGASAEPDEPHEFVGQARGPARRFRTLHRAVRP
jgi:hypothetical protein